MLDQLTEVLETVLKNEKLMKLVASIYKKFYDALIEAGFTEDQAIKIVIAQNNVIPGSGKK